MTGVQTCALPISDVTKESLARMMVGREVVFLITNEKIPPGETVLDIKDLRVVKEDNRETLKDINLRIRRKEIIGLEIGRASCRERV